MQPEVETINKIAKIALKRELSEDDIRSFMVLIRKVLEAMPESEKSKYLILNLFCNWVVHTQITNSNSGLRIVAKINDALVEMRHLGDGTVIGAKMSEILFVGLRRELRLFLHEVNANLHLAEDNTLWGTIFVIKLIESIKNVPLAFPALNDLDKKKKKIYNHIAENSIRPGAGVIAIWIADVDQSKFGLTGDGQKVCLHVRLAETTTIIIPVVIDVRLR